MWDLSGPGLEPVSPALAGGFLTAVLLGKTFVFFFKSFSFYLENFLQPLLRFSRDNFFFPKFSFV